jgi:integrase
MIDGCYSILGVPKSQQSNPFADLKIEKFRYDTAEHGTTKLPLPVAWIRRTIIDESKMPGLNGQARDITIIAADSGTRQSEIYDLPETDIFLDHDIPHIQLRVVTEGGQKRQIKDLTSTRPVVLLGASLEAMRRNPRGFPQYRSKASYSATVNNYLRDNNLFPALPEAATGKYTISGTRHTLEDRMKHVCMDNEERAYLMGHSIAKIRDRPVYGSAPDLRLRALYQEMIAFPTPSWQPRPVAELRRQISHLATEKGFRVE